MIPEPAVVCSMASLIFYSRLTSAQVICQRREAPPPWWFQPLHHHGVTALGPVALVGMSLDDSLFPFRQGRIRHLRVDHSIKRQLTIATIVKVS